MKNAKSYSSPTVREILDGIDVLQKRRIRVKMLLAARLDDLLMEKGLKKKEFANMMGKHPSVITKWLSGTHNFTIDTLLDIENKLESELLRFTEEQDDSKKK